MDIKPKYPRVQKFLNYWHNNIEATINEIHKYLDGGFHENTMIELEDGRSKKIKNIDYGIDRGNGLVSWFRHRLGRIYLVSVGLLLS